MTCSHPYLKKLSPDASVCTECGMIIKKQGRIYDITPLQMPPVVYILTPERWEEIKPWPLMPFKIVKKYGWYISFIYGRQYLVMPVFEKGEGPVFYSARCIEKDCPKKYKYNTPENRERRMWTSGRLGKVVLVGEGIADAAYLSQLAPSLALLGSHGELSRPVITITDGDQAGIEAAFKIQQALKAKGIVGSNAVMLPPGKDPTDLTLAELRKIIKAQTGVRL